MSSAKMYCDQCEGYEKYVIYNNQDFDAVHCAECDAVLMTIPETKSYETEYKKNKEI